MDTLLSKDYTKGTNNQKLDYTVDISLETEINREKGVLELISKGSNNVIMKNGLTAIALAVLCHCKEVVQAFLLKQEVSFDLNFPDISDTSEDYVPKNLIELADMVINDLNTRPSSTSQDIRKAEEIREMLGQSNQESLDEPLDL